MEECNVDYYKHLIDELESLLIKNPDKMQVRKDLVMYYIEVRRINAKGVYTNPDNKDKLQRAIKTIKDDIKYIKSKNIPDNISF